MIAYTFEVRIEVCTDVHTATVPFLIIPSLKIDDVSTAVVFLTVVTFPSTG